ncbi:VanZ family protein [uncultured Parolsenella sp.]|uniref:VanZ family protein n=1 Tax=uncultured Parolsenella sp. TaxID=2083008 RepID=UPI0025D3CCC6|nr:VanZ family protein [uncultured Parolsenella sp.]
MTDERIQIDGRGELPDGPSAGCEHKGPGRSRDDAAALGRGRVRGGERLRSRGLWLLRVVSLVCLVLSLVAIWALTEQSTEGTSRLSASAERVASEVVASAAGAASGGEVSAGHGEAATATGGGEAPAVGSASSKADGSGPSEATQGAIDSTQASEGASDSSQAPDLSKLPRVAAFWLQRVRRVAHAVEFAAVGLFASLTAIFWRGVLGAGPGASRRGDTHGPGRTAGRALATGRGPSACALFAATVCFCALCSLVDQTHKIFVPGRHFDVKDLPFDLAGYLVASLVVFGIWRAQDRVRAGRSATGSPKHWGRQRR